MITEKCNFDDLLDKWCFLPEHHTLCITLRYDDDTERYDATNLHYYPRRELERWKDQSIVESTDTGTDAFGKIIQQHVRFNDDVLYLHKGTREEWENDYE